MRDRKLVEDARGWGRSVHPQQKMPAPAPRNVALSMREIVKDTGG
jgi:dihydroorotase